MAFDLIAFFHWTKGFDIEHALSFYGSRNLRTPPRTAPTVPGTERYLVCRRCNINILCGSGKFNAFRILIEGEDTVHHIQAWGCGTIHVLGPVNTRQT